MTDVFRRRAGYTAASLTLVSLLGACLSEMPRTLPTEPDRALPPRSIPVVSALSSSASRLARPNRVKYKDSGMRPATGRSGSAYLQARALLGADGSALVEASTGDFEGTPGMGRIDKMQLKVLNTGLPTVNEKPQSSRWSRTIPGLAPGDAVQLQANIRTVENPRTEVVTVTTLVARRPDLEITAVNAPAQAYPNAPITFSASVRERNGQMGARADCLLSVDGVLVDVAEDIWVDANGLVDCQFSYAFIATGTYTVAIAAGDVNPGDWDLTNNRASTTVTIIPAGNPVAFGSLQVGDEAYTYTLSQVRTGAYPIQGEYTGSQMQSYMNFYGGTTGIAGPIKRVEARVSVGADEIYASSLTNMMSYQYDDGFATVDCTDYSLTGEQVQSCVSLYRNGTSSAWFYYAHSSGTVTYYGQTLYCQTMGCNTYTTNVNRVTGWAQRYALGGGSVVRVELAFVDAADVKHVVDRGVTLEDRSAPYNYDTTSCAPYFDGLGELCVRRTSTGTVLAGGTSW